MIALALHLTFGTANFQAPIEPPAPATAPEQTPDDVATVPPPTPAPDVAPAPIVYLTSPEPLPAPSVAPPPPPRRFVFAFLPGLTMGVRALPSLNFAFFFGGRLRRSPWILGYQFTFSSGGAERYSSGIMTHRHHITAMRSFGARERGFVSVGGGAALLLMKPVVEVETRVGVRVGARRRGGVAGVARIGWDIGHRERAPMPQIGVVLGVAAF